LSIKNKNKFLFGFQKFREYLLGTSRIARLHAKHDYIRKTLLAGTSDMPPALRGTLIQNTALSVTGEKPIRRKRIGRLQMIGQPKLFGGSLEEYLESTNQEIPLVMKSCIRVINLFGKSQELI
jgi:SLIT-ROBO Rho GTPase activating protein